MSELADAWAAADRWRRVAEEQAEVAERHGREVERLRRLLRGYEEEVAMQERQIDQLIDRISSLEDERVVR
jgi:hypothetical protein